MIIENIHIDRFGKLVDYDVVFSTHLTEICEENGHGKTTIAAFIEAMLYGLDNAKNASKDTHAGLRSRYIPWNQTGKGQKADFGGTLTFTVDGNSYTIVRKFGKTAKSDTVIVINNQSGAETSVFDGTSSIGMQLFGLDADSWREAVLIAPKPSKQANFTESMTKKLLEDGTTDMNDNSYACAMNIVKEARNAYTENTKKRTGAKTSYENEKAALAAENMALSANAQSTEELSRQREQLMKQYVAEKQGQKTYQVMQQQSSTQKSKIQATLTTVNDNISYIENEINRRFSACPTHEQIMLERANNNSAKNTSSTIFTAFAIIILIVGIMCAVAAFIFSKYLLLSGTVIALVISITLGIMSNRKKSTASSTVLRQMYKGNPNDIDNEFLDEIENLITQYDMLKQKKETLVAQLVAINEPQTPASSDAFNLGKHIQDIEHELQVAERDIARKQQIAMRLTEIDRQLQEIDSKIFILDKVSEHLSNAGMQMYKWYIPQAKEKLAHNLTKFAKEDFASYDDTATVAVNDIKGSWYAISSGEKDLLNLCARKAIVDCLFAGERPLMILDDPLVNLDEKNIKSGRELISKMAEDGQILYLTCHKDRVCHACESAAGK